MKGNNLVRNIIIVVIVVLGVTFIVWRVKDAINTGSDMAKMIDLEKELENTHHSVTMKKYLAIETGMSYNAVVNIIGFAGEESARNVIEAIPGAMERVETVMYQWTNRDGSNMNAIFQNNKLNQKAQFGLR